MQNMLIRLLFVWTMRHPASGYVQGINDIAAPFILVFLAQHVPNSYNDNIYDFTDKELEQVEEPLRLEVEADAHWCLSKVIDNL